MKFAACGKRQRLGSSSELLQIENVRLKKEAQTIVIDKTNVNLLILGVEVMNSQVPVKGKLGHVVQIHVYRKRNSKSLYY